MNKWWSSPRHDSIRTIRFCRFSLDEELRFFLGLLGLDGSLILVGMAFEFRRLTRLRPKCEYRPVSKELSSKWALHTTLRSDGPVHIALDNLTCKVQILFRVGVLGEPVHAEPILVCIHTTCDHTSCRHICTKLHTIWQRAYAVYVAYSSECLSMSQRRWVKCL